MVSLRSGVNTSLPFRKYRLVTNDGDNNTIKKIKIKKYSKQNIPAKKVACQSTESSEQYQDQSCENNHEESWTIKFCLANLNYFTDSQVIKIFQYSDNFL